MAEVVYTDDFGEWFQSLDEAEGDSVRAVVDALEVNGLALGHPYSGALAGTRYALRELRPKR